MLSDENRLWLLLVHEFRSGNVVCAGRYQKMGVGEFMMKMYSALAILGLKCGCYESARSRDARQAGYRRGSRATPTTSSEARHPSKILDILILNSHAHDNFDYSRPFLVLCNSARTSSSSALVRYC